MMARKAHFNFLHFKIYQTKVEENIFDVYLNRRSVLDIRENLHIERRAAWECVGSWVLCQHNWCWRKKSTVPSIDKTTTKASNKIEQRTSQWT